MAPPRDASALAGDAGTGAGAGGGGGGAAGESLADETIMVVNSLALSSSSRLRKNASAAASAVAAAVAAAAPAAVAARRRAQPPLWLRLIATLLEGGVRVAARLQGGASVLVHCSDGWDRTSGLTSLAQLLVDPYFRTLEGACVLLQKEWVSFGHQFARRCGTGASDHDRADADDGQRAPIFVQFVDCLWQLHRQQAPGALEWTEAFLVACAEHAYSGAFGTFLHDSDRARAAGAEARGGARGESLWAYCLHPALRQRFADPAFDAASAAATAPLRLRTHPEDLAIWRYWFRCT
jgi:hypothetical protein